MARVSPALAKLIADKVVSPPPSVGVESVSRRLRLNWLVCNNTHTSTSTKTYRTVVASTERMCRRADLGLPFDDGEMAKVARKQTVAGAAKAAVTVKPRVAKTPKAPKVKVPKATAATKAAALPKAAHVRKQKQKAAPVAPSAPEKLKAVLSTPVVAATSSGDKVTATHVYLVLDQSSSMADKGKREAAQKQIAALTEKLRSECADFDVSVCLFNHNLSWSSGVKAKHLSQPYISPSGTTALYDALAEAAKKAIDSSSAALVYLVTDGEEYGSRVNNATTAAASSFFKSCGIPVNCIRKWDGSDAVDLAVVTQQATAGVEQFTRARAAGKTKLDSFFVDVVAQGVTIEAAKKALRDITSSLRVRKISTFVEVEKFVVDELKREYIPGAAYYQLQNATELKVGRRIILQPRGESVFLAGPDVRKLLSLPEDRDIRLEPKNLGDFIIYVQSASTTRKLLPGTQFLYDESHVAGATAPTWSFAAKAGQ